jgi:quinolinate synthase
MTDIISTINNLKKQRDAVILAHYYVEGEVQEIADYVGDSYYLSKMARQAPQQTIVMCGVKFMAESAKILNPEKTVIMPDMTADCPMAHMVTEEEITRIRSKYDDVAVVCYINSTAETKALADVCVTSSNALKIVKALPNKNIFFIPDKNLGRYISKMVPKKNFILNEGFCPTHQNLGKRDIERILEFYPNAKVLVHPECTEEVVSIADYVGSTSGIIDFATENDATEFIMCTEHGILHQLKSKNPTKQFYFTASVPICQNMKKVTLEKIQYALDTMEEPIELDETLRRASEKALRKMHELAE